MSYSYHHALFTKATWESQGSSKLLRSNPWLIMPLEEQGHRALHVEVPTVPLLSANTSAYVQRTFRPVAGNHVASIFSLMEAIDDAKRHRKATPIEKQLGELCIDALELQVPYIKESLVEVPHRASIARTQDFQKGQW